MTRMGVRIVGVLALLLGLLISGLVGISYWTLRAKGESFPGGLHQPALAIEMARSPAEVNQIEQTLAAVKGYTVGNSSRLDIERARDFLTRGVKQDFFFIAIYTLLNLAFCYWLSERELGNRRLTQGLGIFAAVCAAVAGLSDVVENFRLFEVLGGQRSDEMLRELSLATYMKWGSFFLMLALAVAPVSEANALAERYRHPLPVGLGRRHYRIVRPPTGSRTGLWPARHQHVSRRP